MRDLGPLKGYPYGAGHGINDRGQIVAGWDVNYRPYIGGGPGGLLQNFTLRDGRRTVLDNMAPPYLIQAKAINDSGQVAGTTNDSGLVVGAPPAHSRAVVWTGLKVVTLPAPDGFAQTYALALNNKGMVVGTAVREGGHSHAMLWRNGEAVDLGAVVPGGYYCEAYGINDHGQVVGRGSGGAFLWQNGKMEVLKPLSIDSSDIVPRGINDQGQIVGVTFKRSSSSSSFAFLWQKGTNYDLNGLIPADAGWVLQEAKAINNQGQIVGWGSHAGKKRAFLLTPAPYK